DAKQQLGMYHLLEELDQLGSGYRIHAIKEEETRLSGMVLLQGEDWRQALEEMLAKGDALLNENYRIAFGRVYNLDPALLAKSYEEALHSLEYAFVSKQRLYLAEHWLGTER